MSYRSSNQKTINLKSLNIPIGLIIGKGGSNIKQMMNLSGAYIQIKNNKIHIRGDQKSIMAANSLIMDMSSNFTGRSRKINKKKFKTDDEGWTTRGSFNDSKHSRSPPSYLKCTNKFSEPQKVIRTIKTDPNRTKSVVEKELLNAEEELVKTTASSFGSWADLADIFDDEEIVKCLKEELKCFNR